MKIFAFIMAFLVLMQSIMPCGDKDTLVNSGKSQTVVIKITRQQNDTPKDDCSPFCYGACCAGFSLNHSVTSLITFPLLSNNPTTNFLSSEAIEVAFTVWQPPRSC